MPQGQLELVTVGDDYTDAATCIFQHTTFRISLLVADKTVSMQFFQVPPGMQTQAGSWKEPAEFVVPGAGGLSRPFLIGGVRFKNFVPGDIARVCCRAG